MPPIDQTPTEVDTTPAENAGAETPATEAQDAAPAEPAQDAQPAEDAQPTIEVPEAYRGEDGGADVEKLLARVQEADEAAKVQSEAAGEVPETADGYELAVPDDVKLWNDQKLQINPDDPMLGEFKELAHKFGLGTEAAKEFFGMGTKFLASNLNSMFTADKAQVDAEIAKLGDNASETIDSLINSVGEAVGSREDAVALLSEIRSEKTFKALSALVEQANGEGSGRSLGANGAAPRQKSAAEILYPNQAQG